VQLQRTREFDQERERFAFAGACEDCAHFDARRERCRHEYPTEPHRERTLARPDADLVFCKEFELR